MSVTVSLSVTSIIPSLMIYHPIRKGYLTVLDFEVVYFGTCSYESFIVRNYSAETTLFLLTTQDSPKKTINLYGHLDNKFKTWLDIWPFEGILQPFESFVFSVCFRPNKEIPQVGWKHMNDVDNSVWGYLKVVQLAQKPAVEDPSSVAGRRGSLKLAKLKSKEEKESAVCIHGEAEEADIKFTPSCMNMTAEIGDNVVKILKLTNCSFRLPIHFEFHKVPYVWTEPSKGAMGPGNSIDILITFKARSLGSQQTKLIFNIKSHCNMTDKQDLITLKKRWVNLELHAISKTNVAEPKYVQGITPYISNEVGLHTENITFKSNLSKVPRASIVSVAMIKEKPWCNDTFTIAFPNDMPICNYKRLFDETKRSIFRGTPRYFPPPNTKEALSPIEITKLIEQNEKTRNAIRLFAEKRRPGGIKLSFSSERLLETTEPFRDHAPLIKPILPMVEYNEGVKRALTPAQLYKIIIRPSNFNFGLIPVGVECSLVLTFENGNDFPIIFNFVMEEKLIFPKRLKVGAMSNVSHNLKLKMNFTGKFISYFHYSICDIHKFFRTIRAEVVQPFIKFSPSILEFTLSKYNDIFTPIYLPVTIKNPFSSPISFEWQFNQKFAIEIIPEKGIVLESASLTCLVYVHKLYKKKKTYLVKLYSGDAYVNNLIINVAAYTDHHVALVSPVINIKTIVAGSTVNKKFFLFNYGCYSAAYWIHNTNPIEGVEVFPKCGIISPKTLETIEINISIKYIIFLSFYIHIDIEGTSTLKLQVLGNVIFPEIKFEPNELSFFTTKCFSTSCQPVNIINKTSEDIILNFHMAKIIQFKISLSSLHYDSEINEEDFQVKGNSSRTIYVHFLPHHIAAYEFYLPVCINNLLNLLTGEKGSNISATYMTNPNLSDDEPNRTVGPPFFNIPLDPPETFDAVWISCNVRAADITFSCLQLSFEIYKPKQSITKKIIITNPKPENVTVSISKTIYPYGFQSTTGVESPCILQSKETLDVLVTFNPTSTGSWSESIPVLINKQGSTSIYNHIVLSGICHPSSLYCQSSEIYFIPVPLGVRLDKKLEILASYQRYDTELKLTTFCKTHNIDRKIAIEYPEGPTIAKNVDSVMVPVTISFLSSEVISFEVMLLFRDGLEGELIITMFATATDSLIPSHWFYFSSRFEDNQSEQSRTAVYKTGSITSRESLIRRYYTGTIGWRESEITEVENVKLRASTVSNSFGPLPCGWKAEMFSAESLEGSSQYYWSRVYTYVMRWLLHSVFNGSYQPKLEDIVWSRAFLELCQVKNSPASTKSLIDLVVALFGSEVLAKMNLPSDSPPMDPPSRVAHCLKVYTKIIAYLEVYGVGLSHISPIYLLNYDDYQNLYEIQDIVNIDMPKVDLPTNMKSEAEYKLVSKKMWLELYLHLFKSHTLDMCVGLAVVDDWPTTSLVSTVPQAARLSTQQVSFERITPASKIITGDMLDQVSQDKSHSEAVLLAWLTRTYSKEVREELLPLPRLEDGKVLDLGPCLRNGIILAGVTVYYCPFLVETLSNMHFTKSLTEEQIFHNANYLIMAWDEVKLGTMMKPEDLVECHPIFMMMLVAYLYLSLPTFLPNYILRASVALGDSGTTVLSIHNNSNHELRYYPKMYQDSSEPFVIVDKKPLCIMKPKRKFSLKVLYVSNKISKVSGLLILCGANGPNIHGINISVKLEGEPTNIKISNKIIVHLPLYKQVFFHQKIYSPYEKEAEYNMYISFTKPALDMEYLTEWAWRQDCIIPMQVHVGKFQTTILGLGKPGTIHLACCLLFSKNQIRWITFSSPTAGDFITELVLKYYPETNVGKIFIEYPMVNKLILPKEEAFIPVEIKIPTANKSLLKASLNMISLQVKADEVYFYRKYWGKYIGLKLFEMEIVQNCPGYVNLLSRFFENTVTYDVFCDSPSVDTPKSITIRDIQSDEEIVLPIRLKLGCQKKFSAFLKLTAKTQHEVRLHELVFCPTHEHKFSDMSKQLLGS